MVLRDKVGKSGFNVIGGLAGVRDQFDRDPRGALFDGQTLAEPEGVGELAGDLREVDPAVDSLLAGSVPIHNPPIA